MKKSDTGIIKFRCRNLLLVLYPDEDETHKKALTMLETEYESVYIVHDQDLDKEDEDFQKAHVHVVLHCENAIWNTALAKQLGIKENYIRECKDLNRALRYLIHFDNPEKYQYDFDSVKGSKRLKDKLWGIILKADKSQEELSNEILDFIENYGGQLSFMDFMRWINANGLFSNLKSGSGWYRDVLKEHNDKEFKKSRNAYSQLREFRKPKELSEEERSELFE